MLDSKTVTEIRELIKAGKLAELQNLAKTNPEFRKNINQRLELDFTFLLYALVKEQPDIAEWLITDPDLSSEIDINASIDVQKSPNFGGYTALFMAILKHNPPKCDMMIFIDELLKNQKLDLTPTLTQRGWNGCNILHFAIKQLIDDKTISSTIRTNLATIITNIIRLDRDNKLLNNVRNNKTPLDRIDQALATHRDIQTELLGLKKLVVSRGGTTALKSGASTPLLTPMPTPGPTPQVSPTKQQHINTRSTEVAPPTPLSATNSLHQQPPTIVSSTYGTVIAATGSNTIDNFIPHGVIETKLAMATRSAQSTLATENDQLLPSPQNTPTAQPQEEGGCRRMCNIV